MIKALFVTTCLVLVQHQGSSMKELPGVKDYEVVYPKRIHALHKRDVEGAQNPQEKAKYDKTMQYEIEVNGEKEVLHLEKNTDLFSKDYTETHYSRDGKEITTSPQIEDHCYYEGHIQSDTNSAASISACRGLKGYFKSRGKRYLIEPLKLSNSDAHAIFKYESLEKENETRKVCGVTNTTWQAEDPIQKTARASTSAEKPEYLKAKKYIEFYIAADNSVFRKYGRNLTGVRERVFQIVNYVNLVYKPINVYVALTGLEIWSEKDQIDVHADAGTTLERFSGWRRDVLLKRKRNDNAQLLTDIDFIGLSVGLAFVGVMCDSFYSTAVVQDNSRNPIEIGATMAHEMGHNLGMNHDTTGCKCSSQYCIMSAEFSYFIPQLFSSCSLQAFQNYIAGRNPQCIVNMPLSKDIIAPPVCGNDFVEEGEQCDCGSPEECTDDCCDAKTCKLKPGAKCGYGECCESCQLRRAGAVCRPAKHECDLSELCTGLSHQCPSDHFRVNGYPCKNNQGYCYMGKCPTLADQCTFLWGSGAKVGPDYCFDVNEKGIYYGYCKKANGTFLPCGKKDLKCGRLYCTGGTYMPTIGNLVVFGDCRGSFPRGDQEDGGMVEAGTKCGDSMVCSDSQCLHIESAYRSTNCANKCHGHAVCDHELQCQCEEGWIPPNCDNGAANRYIIAIVVVLVALVVTAVVVAILFRYKILRKKTSQSSHKSVAGSTNPGFSGQEQNRRQHMGPPPGRPEKIPGGHMLPPMYQNAKMPTVKPKIPPPPVPAAKPALPPVMRNAAAAMKPVPFPHFKSKATPPPPPPPPPQALKPPRNYKV